MKRSTSLFPLVLFAVTLAGCANSRWQVVPLDYEFSEEQTQGDTNTQNELRYQNAVLFNPETGEAVFLDTYRNNWLPYAPAGHND
ncbi:MAG: hypothetical protein AAGA29_06835 [Planctomycetota bacterium]